MLVIYYAMLCTLLMLMQLLMPTLQRTMRLRALVTTKSDCRVKVRQRHEPARPARPASSQRTTGKRHGRHVPSVSANGRGAICVIDLSDLNKSEAMTRVSRSDSDTGQLESSSHCTACCMY